MKEGERRNLISRLAMKLMKPEEGAISAKQSSLDPSSYVLAVQESSLRKESPK